MIIPSCLFASRFLCVRAWRLCFLKKHWWGAFPMLCLANVVLHWLMFGSYMFSLCLASICLLLCSAVLVFAHLTWLVAWLSCHPCRTWTVWSFHGVNYAFACACFYETSMGHYTWYLVPCNERSLLVQNHRHRKFLLLLPWQAFGLNLK
jgi:hypothetical protein